MAHELEQMAYAVGSETPWHGLGNTIDADASIEDWQRAAGLDWTVSKRPVMFKSNEDVHSFSDKFVLARDLDNKPYSVVSGRYKPVQPKDVLEFFRDLISTHGMTIETAGSLKDGKRIWALAKTGDAHKVLGNDLVNSYLLIATSYDLTFSTLAQFTSVRVVCNNTLQQSMRDFISRVTIPHFRDFDAKSVHEQLGLGRAQWGAFSSALDAIAKIKVDSVKAKEVLDRVFKVPEETITYIDPQVQKVLKLFEGKAIGADIAGQTGWGLVNAVTEYADHHKRARNQGNRLDNAWFGEGAALKDAVFQEVLELAA